MASYGDDATLMKVAVFGIAMSIFCTLGIQIMLVEASGDYDYDDIQAYKNDLIQFSGQTMINNSPWVLTHVYTPWDPATGVADHYSEGWMYGEDYGPAPEDDSRPAYPGYMEAADIRLDPDQKSSVPLSYTREAIQEESELKWWAKIPVVNVIGIALGQNPIATYQPALNNWNYTGYRYVFDPTLPFATEENKPSAHDGSLSIVWYTYNGQEGLSGGLDIYGGRHAASNDTIKLASYSAADIVADYNLGSPYATVYDFDFNGTHLNLSIRFDADAIESGMPLMQAWTEGKWSMAISSISAGNFLDIENSTAFSDTMGGMFNTFIKIFTFSLPEFNNPWAAMILWLMVGLPMTIALLCVTLRAVKIIPGLG